MLNIGYLAAQTAEASAKFADSLGGVAGDFGGLRFYRTQILQQGTPGQNSQSGKEFGCDSTIKAPKFETPDLPETRIPG
jgi:hypothetical protein